MQQHQNSSNKRHDHKCHLNCGGSLLRSRTSMLAGEPSVSQICSNNKQIDEGFASSSAAVLLSSRPTIGFDTTEYLEENGFRTLLNDDRQHLTESDPGGGNYLLCR
jgi:hypothetical protein